jgi:hypothetical protein
LAARARVPPPALSFSHTQRAKMVKIRIELDVDQAEVPGITQMLETLR